MERNFASGSSRQTGARPPFQTEAATRAERLLQEGDARGRRVRVKTNRWHRMGRSQGEAGWERWGAEQGGTALLLVTRLSFFVALRGVRWRPGLETLPHWGGTAAFGQGAGSMVHVGVLGPLSGDLPRKGCLWRLWGPRGRWWKVELEPRSVAVREKMLGPLGWLYWQEAVTRWRRWVESLRQNTGDEINTTLWNTEIYFLC